MRKAIKQCRGAVSFDVEALGSLERQGFKFVQVRGINADLQYDYLAPRILLLIPMRELPADPREKDIYEPIPSQLLQEWAKESDEHFKIFVVHPS